MAARFCESGGADYRKGIKRICDGNSEPEDSYRRASCGSGEMPADRRMSYIRKYADENGLFTDSCRDRAHAPVPVKAR